MDILIVRHGVAVPRETPGHSDNDRPLTKEGIRKMEKAAVGMVRVADQPGIILTSPLPRAKSTAEIVAAAFGRTSAVKMCEELLPGASIDRLIAVLARHVDKKTVMVVGHNPDLLLFSSALLGSQRSLLALRKGSLCLIRVPGVPGTRPGTLEWHLTSKQLRLIASTAQ